MLDFSKLEQYMENNRIEAKQSLGGLPHSIWETYSAFANTMGGYILLGVEERSDKTFGAMDLPNPEELIREFWKLVNNPSKVSANILSAGDVTVQKIDGKHIVSIYVPRAERVNRPVYTEGNPRNCYRRNGEGDYKCTEEERLTMCRDAALKTQDMRIIEELGTEALNFQTVRRFGLGVKAVNPESDLCKLSYEEFLVGTGAADRGADGKLHPTGAGLLMFGHVNDIMREYPDFYLDYRENCDLEDRSFGNHCLSSRERDCNLFDFHIEACDNLKKFCKDYALDDGILFALKEALTNSLVNADYFGRRGVCVSVKQDCVTVSNPGNSRVGIRNAISGGTSDPRNASLQRMFRLNDIGKQAGSGIPNIFSIWREHGFYTPVITESFEPERYTLTLPLSAEAPAGSRVSLKSGQAIKPEMQRSAIIEFLTVTPEGTVSDFENLLGAKVTGVKTLLEEMVKEGLLEAEGENRNRKYNLRRKSGLN